MIKLEKNNFQKVTNLIKSQNELSVLSVINGLMPGEIYVNSDDNPTAALIKTSECNYIAGSTNDIHFNTEVSAELDFWDQLTPDSIEWMDIIPEIHKNHFVRKYQRRHYSLSIDDFRECKEPLKEGFMIERVDINSLKQNNYENSEKLLEWISNWDDEASFKEHGTGYYIHNGKVIVSWSLSDCYFDKSIAIGIQSEERYRRNGFGKIVVTAVIKECFRKGYEKIDWLCVDSNKGSIALAEKLGFQYGNCYNSFSVYPPIENVKDLSDSEWSEWGEYLERAAQTVDLLIWDSLYCYIKSNDVENTIRIMTSMEQKKAAPDYLRFQNYIEYLQGYGLCSNFKSPLWMDFMRRQISE